MPPITSPKYGVRIFDRHDVRKEAERWDTEGDPEDIYALHYVTYSDYKKIVDRAISAEEKVEELKKELFRKTGRLQ